jgi:hypothetical protein
VIPGVSLLFSNATWLVMATQQGNLCQTSRIETLAEALHMRPSPLVTFLRRSEQSRGRSLSHRKIALDKRQTVIALAVTFVLVMLAMLIYSESASDLPLIARSATPYPVTIARPLDLSDVR